MEEVLGHVSRGYNHMEDFGTGFHVRVVEGFEP
jgi:hypothetical protein